MKAFYDTHTSGLVPIKFLRFEEHWDGIYVLVEVRGTRGAYHKGLVELLRFPNRYLVKKAFRSGHRQYVIALRREEIEKLMERS